MNKASILDVLTTIQMTPDPNALPPEFLFRASEYWVRVAIVHERHGRDAQAIRLRANAKRMQQTGLKMELLRLLCARPDHVIRRNKIKPANVSADPALVAWLVEWFDKGDEWTST